MAADLRITGVPGGRGEPPAPPGVVADRAVLQEIWDANLLLRQYLGSIDNPELVVYRVRPLRVRFMREWALDYHEVPATDLSA